MDVRSRRAGGDEPPRTQRVEHPQDHTPAAPSRKPPPVRRHPSLSRAARTTARILLVLVGLATVALGFSRFVDAYDTSVAYLGAPACAALAAPPAEDCTTRETGRVTGRRVGSNENSDCCEVTVSREVALTTTYVVTEGLYRSLRTGDDVDLTLWNGRVVELSHQGHRSPVAEAAWSTSLKLALLVGAGTALTVFTLLQGHRDGWIVPAAVCLFLSFCTFLGSAVLVAAQWPFALTLALPIAGWLVLTTAVTAMCREY